MTKRIVVITRDLITYIGEPYISDESMQAVFIYNPYTTMQDFNELNKVKQIYHLKDEEIERWWVNIKKK